MIIIYNSTPNGNHNRKREYYNRNHNQVKSSTKSYQIVTEKSMETGICLLFVRQFKFWQRIWQGYFAWSGPFY